jgi:hypothetical protein
MMAERRHLPADQDVALGVADRAAIGQGFTSTSNVQNCDSYINIPSSQTYRQH